MNEIIVKALSDFLAVVLPVLLSALAAVAVNYFRLLEEKIKNEKPDVYKIIDTLVRQAVSAAEQTGVEKTGREKMDYAVNYVQGMLDSYGLKGIDVSLIETKIEAAVFDELKRKW